MNSVNSVNLSLEINSKNIPSVFELRRNKYLVRIIHYRYVANPQGPELIPQIEIQYSDYLRKNMLHNGGLTVVEVTTPDKKHTYKAEAKCHLVDNFNRKRGVKIALGRVMKQIQFDLEVPF